MQNRIYSIVAIVATSFLLSSQVYAQDNCQNKEKQTCCKKQTCPKESKKECKKECKKDKGDANLKLTEDQKKKIHELKAAHHTEILETRNKIQELRNRLQELSTAKEVDMNAINNTIDEITANQNKLMKSREKHKQAVRAVLSDEQRVKYDIKRCSKGKKQKYNQE